MGSLYFRFYQKLQSLHYDVVVILCRVSVFSRMQEGLHSNSSY